MYYSLCVTGSQSYWHATETLIHLGSGEGVGMPSGRVSAKGLHSCAMFYLSMPLFSNFGIATFQIPQIKLHLENQDKAADQ